MITINQANAKNLSTTAAAGKAKGHPKKGQAAAEAVHTIGPHAREGFEFNTYKAEGRWFWRATDETTRKPETPAQLKANGGKRSLKSLARELSDRAHGNPASEQVRQIVNGNNVPPVQPPDEYTPVVPPEVKDPATTLTPTPAKGDNLEIPPFLRREPETEEKRDERLERSRKTSGPQREIVMPKTKANKPKVTKGADNGTGKAQNKTKLIGEMLTRKEGCTTAEILAATGWPAVSVPRQAQMVGLELRKEKEGSVTRYYGVPKK